MNHSKLGGLKFCIECGAPAESGPRLCTQGHELVRKNKFCEVCGSAEANELGSPPAVIQRNTNQPISSSVNQRPAQPIPAKPEITAHEVPVFTPPAKKNKAIIIGASIASLILILSLVIVNANKVEYTSVTVTMNIYDQDCWNLSWGYYDIPNGQIMLTVDGETVAYANYPRYGEDTTYACSFSTTLYDVPMNGDFYEISMTSGRRGTVTNSRSDMEANSWNIDLSLGL